VGDRGDLRLSISTCPDFLLPVESPLILYNHIVASEQASSSANPAASGALQSLQCFTQPVVFALVLLDPRAAVVSKGKNQ
jgi:hypothetical protein